MSRRCPTPEARAKAGEEFRRRSSSSVTTSTPGDEVAQRARAAAGEIAKGMGSFFVDGYTEIIIKHFATDVEQGTCTWTCEPNPDIEMWETDCGNAFQFEVGGPTENKMKFCCYCGKRLVGKTAEGEGDG